LSAYPGRKLGPVTEASSQAYVALLRGINVGAHNRVAMADLRALMSGLGYRDVRTHLQSGNVVFRAPPASTAELEEAIAERLAAELGLPVAVLVRTGDEVRDVVAGNRLPTHEPSRLMVLFLSGPPAPGRIEAIDPDRYAPEQFAVRDTEIYLYCANGILSCELTKVFADRRLGCAVTARNWNTVTKLAALLDR
jgi:uncharacterized protein (DUF1697 family)